MNLHIRLHIRLKEHVIKNKGEVKIKSKRITTLIPT